MERLIKYNSSSIINTDKTVHYEEVASEINQEVKKEDAPCMLKNLLKTNIKLLRLNDIRSVLLF